MPGPDRGSHSPFPKPRQAQPKPKQKPQAQPKPQRFPQAAEGKAWKQMRLVAQMKALAVPFRTCKPAVNSAKSLCRATSLSKVEKLALRS